MTIRIPLANITLISVAVLNAAICSAATIPPITELGAAGPGNWSVLDAGNFSLSDPSGYIHGNVGEASGSFTDGGSAGVKGTIFLGTGVGNTTVAGDVLSLNSAAPASALTLANAAAAYYNGLSADFTSVPSAGTVTPGVYKITGDWSPNGGTYNLNAGQIYVFDISGNFKPSSGGSPLFINDTTPGDVIFNIHGNLQSSGGSSTYPMMDGVFLAQGSISLTPGFVDGEIISETSINIASKGAVQGTVPDNGSTFVLLGLVSVALVAKFPTPRGITP